MQLVLLTLQQLQPCELELYGLPEDSVQRDIKFLDVLAQMGAKIKKTESSVIIKKSKLHGIDIDMNAMPDAALT